MRFWTRPGQVWLAAVGGAVVLGGAGWLLGPVWVLAGVAAGPPVALIVVSMVQVFTAPDPADLLRAGRGREALQLAEYQMLGGQRMARIWPGQFREVVAHQMMDRSMALLATLRESEALVAAEEGVAIYRSLATARPGKYAVDLATALNNLSYPLRAAGRRDEALAAADEAVRIYRSLTAAHLQKYRYNLACSLGTRAELLSGAGELEQALAATSEAAQIYQDMRPADRAAPAAVEVLCLHGQLLCDLSRSREAAQPLARARCLAAGREGQVRMLAEPALKAAYLADPAGFRSTWRAETGADPPDWLTGLPRCGWRRRTSEQTQSCEHGRRDA